MTKTNLKFAGIGSRETPEEILEIMENISEDFCKIGFILRSGGAKGADQSFERGCNRVNGNKEIFYAKDATDQSIKLAQKYTKNIIGNMRKYVQRLLGRNMQIINGINLNDPVEFVVCYT